MLWLRADCCFNKVSFKEREERARSERSHRQGASGLFPPRRRLDCIYKSRGMCYKGDTECVEQDMR